MRFMIFVKASQTSESGAMPSQELIEAMGKYNQAPRASCTTEEGCSRRLKGLRHQNPAAL
jgi:hypothetical protein